MDKDQTHCYELVKTAILKRYNINEETYRQRFRAAREELQESFVELQVRLRDTFDIMEKPKERTSKELADFMVMEQLIEDTPREAQMQVREKKRKTAREAEEMVDDYYLARKAATGGDKRCYKCDPTVHLAVECKVVREGFDGDAVEGNRNPQNAKRLNHTATASRNQTWNTRQEGSTRTPPRGQTWKQDEPWCYKCNRLGHIATCPNSANGSGSAPLRGYLVDDKKKEIPCVKVWKKEERVRDGEGEHCCSGFVEGQAVKMVLDTGASCT